MIIFSWDTRTHPETILTTQPRPVLMTLVFCYSFFPTRKPRTHAETIQVQYNKEQEIISISFSLKHGTLERLMKQYECNAIRVSTW